MSLTTTSQNSTFSTTDSQPVHPEAPSFLDLAPEIRNAVYSLCFEQARPITISCTSAGNGTMITRSLDKDITSSTSLFLTCRQIYLEAASLFYSNNRFIMENRSAYHCGAPAIALESWLKSLGSQFRLLRKLDIWLWGICPVQCYMCNSTKNGGLTMNGAIDVFGLVKMLWEIPNERLRLGFRWSSQDGLMQANESQLAQIVMALGAYDVLKLRRHKLAIKKIMVKRDGSGGCFILRGSPQYLGVFQRNFIAADGGTTLVLDQRAKPEFLHLPPCIVGRICSEVSCPARVDNDHGKGLVHVDLDTRTCTGASPALLAVSRSLRSANELRFWLYNDFVVKMTAFEHRGKFGNFGLLRKWWCTERYRLDPWAARAPKSVGNLQVLLHFNIEETHDLASIRVNAIDLIAVLCYASNCKTSICFSLERGSQNTVCLSKIQRVVFRILARIEAMCPRAVDFKCPELWVNGFGEVAEINAVGALDIDIEHAMHGWPNEDSVKEFLEKDSLDWRRRVPKSYDGTLGIYLGYLRRVLWDGEEVLRPRPYFTLDYTD